MTTPNHKQAQYTSGPWINRNDGTNAQIIAANGRNDAIALVYSGGTRYGGGESEASGNARLIAAAPELLEVAPALIGAGPKYSADGVCKLSTREVVEMARAAISKAEGRAS